MRSSTSFTTETAREASLKAAQVRHQRALERAWEQFKALVSVQDAINRQITDVCHRFDRLAG